MKFAILIIEDDTEKLRRILTALEQIPGFDAEAVVTEIDAHSAKQRMMTQAFDLLILDISIPPRKSAEVQPEGGLTLLQEVLEREQYHTPTHIIALTAHDNVLATARAQLAENVLLILHYQVSSDGWQRQLRSGVEQRMAAKKSVGITPPSYEYDVAFICALRSELEAVRNNGWSWSALEIAHDDGLYYQATFTKHDGRSGSAVATVAARMGMPAAAAATMKLIMRFKPHYLFMTGIMGGIDGRVNLGDLIVANPVWDWGSGKWTTGRDGNSTSGFEADPFQFTLDTAVERMALRLEENGTELYRIRQSFGKGSPERDLKLRIGAVASGAAVLADQTTLDRIKDQHRKLLGIEMEAYGVFSAAAEAPYPKPLCICIKAVVDFGDGRKDDTYQLYGAHVSAKAAQFLIENYCK
jgi:nucleoside phosphorylase/CheY-like chemotaxis protein